MHLTFTIRIDLGMLFAIAGFCMIAVVINDQVLQTKIENFVCVETRYERAWNSPAGTEMDLTQHDQVCNDQYMNMIGNAININICCSICVSVLYFSYMAHLPN